MQATAMSNRKRRRKWTASQKLKTILEKLQSDRQRAAICRREGLSPNLVYQWRRQLLRSAESLVAELIEPYNQHRLHAALW